MVSGTVRARSETVSRAWRGLGVGDSFPLEVERLPEESASHFRVLEERAGIPFLTQGVGPCFSERIGGFFQGNTPLPFAQTQGAPGPPR